MSNPYSKFRLAKRFNGPPRQQQITTLDYDDSGQFLIATSINKSIQLYDTMKGRFMKAVQSQKYGCHSAKFTHNSHHCIYASSTSKEDHTIRYLSLHDNTFLRYFKGHKGLVNSLEMSPTQDLAVSTSMDDTVRLWDLRASNSQGFITSKAPSYTSFDPSGLVCALGSSPSTTVKQGSVKLKDIRMFTDSAFLEFDLPAGFLFNKIEFSNDNKFILLSSTNGDHLIYDSFDGKLVNTLSIGSFVPPSDWPSSGTACFTPEGKYVLSGNGEGSISLFEPDDSKIEGSITASAKLLNNLDFQPRMVLFNPKFQQFATADLSVNFWLPPE